jgi:hypothetical protein
MRAGCRPLVAMSALAWGAHAAPVVTLALTSSASETTAGNAVTLTAAVSGATLSGSIVFTDGAVVIGTAGLKNGRATLATAPAVGIHRFAAAYRSATRNLDSGALSVVVDNALACR